MRTPYKTREAGIFGRSGGRSCQARQWHRAEKRCRDHNTNRRRRDAYGNLRLCCDRQALCGTQVRNYRIRPLEAAAWLDLTEARKRERIRFRRSRDPRDRLPDELDTPMSHGLPARMAKCTLSGRKNGRDLGVRTLTPLGSPPKGRRTQNEVFLGAQKAGSAAHAVPIPKALGRHPLQRAATRSISFL